MADGKDRSRILERFDEDLSAPEGGWAAVDRALERAITTAPD